MEGGVDEVCLLCDFLPISVTLFPCADFLLICLFAVVWQSFFMLWSVSCHGFHVSILSSPSTTEPGSERKKLVCDFSSWGRCVDLMVWRPKGQHSVCKKPLCAVTQE